MAVIHLTKRGKKGIMAAYSFFLNLYYYQKRFPLIFLGSPKASLLPRFPKQTLLQKRTLAIQVHTQILLSVVIKPLLVRSKLPAT